MADPEQIKSFWRQMRMTAPDDCWEWGGKISEKGYPALHAHTQADEWSMLNAARVALALAHQQSPGDQVVIQTCNNKLCCNPGHLATTTRSERVRRDLRRGIVIGRARNVDWELAEDIRMRYAQGDRICDLARDYRLQRTTIRQIILDKTYRYPTRKSVPGCR